MMNRDEWLQSLLAIVRIIADEEFQKRVWLNGNCNDTSVISWEEAVSRFFDDSDADGFISIHLADIYFSDLQRLALQSFRDRFQAYVDQAPRENGFIQPKALLSDPEWQAVIHLANNVLQTFGKHQPGSV